MAKDEIYDKRRDLWQKDEIYGKKTRFTAKDEIYGKRRDLWQIQKTKVPLSPSPLPLHHP